MVHQQAVVRQQTNKTRLPWRKLCLDILSVMCGLRPAAMLDYAVVPRRVLLQLAAAVRTTAGPAGMCLGAACSRCWYVAICTCQQDASASTNVQLTSMRVQHQPQRNAITATRQACSMSMATWLLIMCAVRRAGPDHGRA